MLCAIGLWNSDGARNQIEVIDCDLGESGTADREGFRHLMAEVGLGHAGIVLGLEVSRLARDNIDWHRLLEVCATTNTLILDEDGLYSPQDHNDRLLLGLKGAMSAAELHVLRSRLRGGILSQAQRGALKLPLPAGFVYDPDRSVVLDPDAEVRNVIRLVFSTFERSGSSWGVVRHFEERGLTFPLREGRGYSPGPGSMAAADGDTRAFDASQSALRRCLRIRSNAPGQLAERFPHRKARCRRLDGTHPGRPPGLHPMGTVPSERSNPGGQRQDIVARSGLARGPPCSRVLPCAASAAAT